jgi:undecaprenyl-diphosphatase
MTIFQAIILGIIEGLTEFLPVSSTGHMILATAWMNMYESEFVKTFEIAIQLGAILAVLTVYYKRFFVSLEIYTKLAVAFLPTGIIGFLLYKTIKAYLFNPIVVSISLIIGGIVLILMDKWSEKDNSKYLRAEDISYAGALKIGLIQCISMVPGVSRAAATIFGGIFNGFNRKQAAEFSFLLAIPTMFAATGYDLLKTKAQIGTEELTLLAIGGLVAFVFALLAVKTFIGFITKYGFKYFGIYRIILGILFLAIALTKGIKMEL